MLKYQESTAERVFCGLTPCRMAEIFDVAEETLSPSLEIPSPEGEVSIFLRNVGKFVTDCTTLVPNM